MIRKLHKEAFLSLSQLVDPVKDQERGSQILAHRVTVE